MRILSVSSELSPLVQSGGLGDAVSGQARALGALGHEVTCVIPGTSSARHMGDNAAAGSGAIPPPQFWAGKLAALGF